MKTTQKKEIKETKKQQHFIDSSVWIELYLKERRVEEVISYIGELKRGKYNSYINATILGEIMKALVFKSKDPIGDIVEFTRLLILLKVNIIPTNHKSIYSTYNEIYENVRASKKDSMDILNLTSAINYKDDINLFVTLENIEKPLWNNNYIKTLRINIKML